MTIIPTTLSWFINTQFIVLHFQNVCIDYSKSGQNKMFLHLVIVIESNIVNTNQCIVFIIKMIYS